MIFLERFYFEFIPAFSKAQDNNNLGGAASTSIYTISISSEQLSFLEEISRSGPSYYLFLNP